MISKIYYAIVGSLILITLLACELFEQGYGDKVDLKAPTVSISSPLNGDYKMGSFVLKGLATDDTSIKSVVVKYISNVTQEEQTLTAFLSESNWHVDIHSENKALISDGPIEFVVTATDSADKTTKTTTILNIDNTAPTVLVSSPTSEDKDLVNGIINIKGSVEENLKLKEIRVSIVSSTDNNRKFSVNTSGADWTASIDSLTNNIGLNSPEVFNIDIEAEDFAGNISSFYYYKSDLTNEEVKKSLNVSTINSRTLIDPNNSDKLVALRRNIDSNPMSMTIDQNQDTPKIILSDWDLATEDNYKPFSSDVFLSGRVIDDDGIDEIVLSVYNGNSKELIRKGIRKGHESRSINLEVKLESQSWDDFDMVEGSDNPALAEGLYYYTIDVTDIEGKVSGQASLPNPAKFGIDKTNPEISITSPVQDAYYNSSFDIKGTATDAVDVKTVQLFVNNILSGKADITGDNWSYTLNSSGMDGRITIKAEAADSSGKTSSDTIVVSIDKTTPKITEVNIPKYLNETVLITVGATDNSLDTVTAKIGTDDLVCQYNEDTDKYDITLDTTKYSNGAELVVTATDKAKNTVSETHSLDIDQNTDKPRVVFKAPESSGLSFNGTVNFWIELFDDDLLDKATVDFKLFDNSNNSIAIDNSKLDISEPTQIDADTNSITVRYSTTFDDDGTYTAKISVKDKVDGRDGKLSNIGSIGITSDSKGPVLTINESFDSLSYKNNDYTILGTAIDTISNVSSVVVKTQYTNNSAKHTYTLNVDSENKWTSNIDVSDISNGSEDTMNLSIEAFDDAGNSSGAMTRTVIVDKIDPIENITSSLNDLNGIVEITGESTDNNLDNVEVLVGGDPTSVASIWSTAIGKYSWVYQINTKLLTDNAVTKLYIRGVDKAGNRAYSTYDLNVNQNSDKPEITFDSSITVTGDATVNNFTQSGKITGTVIDDDGVDHTKIKITFSNNTEYTATPTFNNGKRVDWEVDLNSEIPEGVYTFKVEASDLLSSKLTGDSVVSSSIDDIDISIDNGAPTLSFSDESPLKDLSSSIMTYINTSKYINTESGGLQDLTITNLLKGTATDGTSVESLVVTYSKDGEAYIELLRNEEGGKSKDWSATLPTDDGAYDIKIVATDAAGNKSILERRLVVDRIQPIITISSPSPNENVTDPGYTVRGTVTDGSGRGVKKLEYSVDSGVNWIPITIKFSWEFGYNFTVDEGSKNLIIRADDGLNDSITESVTFYKDSNPPSLTETGVDGNSQVYKNAPFTLTGDVSDTIEFDKLVLSATKDGEVQDLNGATAGNDKTLLSAAGDYTYNITITDASLDGEWIYTLRAYDKAGNTKVINRKVFIDKSIPTDLTITSTLRNSETATGDKFFSGDFTVDGTVIDNGSGISKVYYSLKDNPYVLEPTDWKELTGTDNWYGTIDLSSESVALDKKISFYAIDRAGNAGAIKEDKYTYDINLPESNISGTWGVDQYKTTGFTITNTASDDNDIKTMVISGGGAAANTETLPVWSSVVTPSVEGISTISIVTTDNADRINTEEIKYFYDSAVPETNINNFSNDPSKDYKLLTPADLTASKFIINGSAIDTGSGIDKIYSSINYTDDANNANDTWDELTGTGSWSYTLTGLTNTTATQYIYFKSTDKAGRESSVKTAAYWYSSAKPSTTVTGLADPVVFVNSNVTIGGTASDDNGITSVVVKSSMDGAIASELNVTGTAPWSIDFPITVDGIYDIEIIVTDDAGEVTTETKTIKIDTTQPTLTVTTLEKDSIVESTSFTLKGTVDDGDGKGVAGIQYSRNNSDWVDITVPTGVTWSKSIDFSTPVGSETAEGARTIYIRATDGLNDYIQLPKIEFYYDTADPTLTETKYSVSTEQISKTAVTLTGIVKDDGSGLKSFKVKVNGGAETDAGISLAEDIWSYELTAPTNHSKDRIYSLEFTATDNAGRTSRLTRNIIIDTTKPTVKVDDVSGYVSGTVSISGTGTDSLSGIKEIKYKLDSGAWATASGSNPWLGSLDLSSVIDGDHTLTVKAFDNAGNESEPETTPIKIDKANPETTIVATDTETTPNVIDLSTFKYIKTDIVLTGVASDGNDIKSIVVKSNGDIITLKAGVDLPAWEVNSPITVEGVYDIEVIVTDDADKTTIETRSFGIDKTPVVLFITSPTSSETVNNQEKTIDGTVTDGGGEGVTELQYSVDNSTWTTVTNPDYGWSFTDIDFGATEGSKTLYVKATDGLNGWVNQFASFNFDSAPPTLTASGTTAEQKSKDAVEITGTASDTNSLSTFTVSVNGGVGTPVNIDLDGVDNNINTTVDNNTWIYTVPKTTDGTFNLKFVATDAVEKITTENRKITIDATAPSLSIDSVKSIVGAKTVNGAITLDASASDAGGLVNVKYTIATSEPTNWDDVTTILSPTDYKATINTTSITDGDYNIYVRAVDSFGNGITKSFPITINQDSNIPVITFSNLTDTVNAEITGVATTGINTSNFFSSTYKIVGTIQDDDKVNASSIMISTDGGANWTNVTEQPSSNSPFVTWSHTFNESSLLEGNNRLKIKVLDTSSTPITEETDDIYFYVDKGNPVVTVTEPAQSAYVKGAARTSGTATDGTGLKSFTITASTSSVATDYIITKDLVNNEDQDANPNFYDPVKGTNFTGSEITSTTTDENRSYAWDFALESLPDGYENKSITLTYRAEDYFTNITEKERSITIDTTAPVIDIQYPSKDAVVTGEVTIRGITTEEKMSKVEIKLGSADWEVLPGTYNWSKTINSVAPAIYELGESQVDGTYNFPVLVRATDAAGNITTEESYSFFISPDLDKPTVSVTTPEDNSKLGGSILFIGTATDNEAVSKVYIRVDVNGDGDFVDNYDLDDNSGTTHMFDNESVWNEITDFGNSVWKQEINTQGLLYEENTNINPDQNDKTGLIKVQFKAVDIKGVESLLVTRTIDIDKSFPEITQFEVQGGGTDVSGEFTLAISTTDTGGGITNIDISYNGGISYEPLFSGVGNNVTETLSITKDSVGSLGYDNSSDIINIRLKVTDTTGYQSFSNLQLNVDNIVPTATYTARVDDIGTNDGTNTDTDVISGTFQDSGFVSSFDRVEVYITQDGVLKNPKTGSTVTHITKDFGDGDVIYPENPTDLITIDKMTELGDDAGGNGDGDGYDEYITTASGIYNWTVEYDTSAIDPANGSVELHYVVYDKAGNSKHYVEIMLIVGSDLDASETVEESEQIAYPQGFQARSGLLYIELYSGTKDGYHLEITDTNGGAKTTTSGNTQTTLDTSAYSNGEVSFTIKIYEGTTLKLTKVLVADMKGADEVPPTITVNDITASSVIDGHFDMGDYTSGVSADSNDLDISGEVQFTGAVTDETRIKDIRLKITGETDIVLAEWVGGIFKAVDPNTTIVSQTLHWKDGHSVDFTYNWDTSTISGVANSNRVVTFTVNDFITDHTVTDVDQFDVVPYISSVKTSLSNAYASESSVFNRSSLGLYPVRENEEIEINGFNLKDGTVKVVGNLNVISTTMSKITADIGNTEVSGDLTVTVNGVNSINNSNSNTSANNKEGNGINNEKLTDDRTLRIWKFDEIVNSSTVRYPNMSVSKGEDEAVGFVYDSGAQFVRMNIDGSDFQVDMSYTQWYDTAFAMDVSGRAYGASMNGDSGGDGSQDNGRYANFKYYAWNTSAKPGTNSTSNASAYESGSKSQAIENAYNDSIFNSNRVLNPKMTTFMDGATQRVFMTYYDSSSNEIKYRAGTVTGSSNTPTFGGALVNHDNGTAGSAPNYQSVSSSTSTQKPGKFSDVAVFNDSTKGLMAVMVWYDAITRSLIYSWNDDPTGASAAKWQANATVIDSNFAGWYADIEVDSDNGIHIAYYNSSDGSLKYAYKSTYNTAATTVTVDSFLSTGENLSLTVKKVDTKQVPYISYYMGSYSSTNYSVRTAWREDFTSLKDGVEFDKYTGAWEVMTIPTSNNPKKYNIGIGIKSGVPILGYATDVNIETATIKE